MPNQSQYSENNQYMFERNNNLDKRKPYINMPNQSRYSEKKSIFS